MKHPNTMNRQHTCVLLRGRCFTGVITLCFSPPGFWHMFNRSDGHAQPPVRNNIRLYERPGETGRGTERLYVSLVSPIRQTNKETVCGAMRHFTPSWPSVTFERRTRTSTHDKPHLITPRRVLRWHICILFDSTFTSTHLLFRKIKGHPGFDCLIHRLLWLRFRLTAKVSAVNKTEKSTLRFISTDKRIHGTCKEAANDKGRGREGERERTRDRNKKWCLKKKKDGCNNSG